MRKHESFTGESISFYKKILWAVFGLICLLAGTYALYFKMPEMKTEAESIFWLGISTVHLTGIIFFGIKLDHSLNQA